MLDHEVAVADAIQQLLGLRKIRTVFSVEKKLFFPDDEAVGYRENGGTISLRSARFHQINVEPAVNRVQMLTIYKNKSIDHYDLLINIRYDPSHV